MSDTLPGHASPNDASSHEAEPIAATRRWLERAVIGLNLCPFAKAVLAKGQVRFVLSDARTPQALLEELASELVLLEQSDPERIDTTLLIHPQVLQDFFDFNDFLDLADGAVAALDLEGEIQVASFHPDYQFAGTGFDEVGNCTNRSPYPTLHLLREASVERAVAAFPDPDVIVERNLETLQKLGFEGWRALLAK
ncbi:hypothetical protein LC55x_0760 [Lysobacter capsici]|jgi:hypothetical protein|uniref:DUF1415 domain-containing protein n=1 Tax=Lysobacter capsici AZ78 TaxID=1444315 RepID=A0A120AGL2_9GAMM|nr:DUF1415 domain-containing protein [Lysobacter capsici]ALN84058.1 hypothetical protein LC55x_0760 [Lysobacter capsici]ATE74471.1 DUF1415 domain-containing protein [Lysobacter capsici]KWS04758.1 hypothetical protein AZ78_2308 [Lysobacter capsici AZ78]WND81438.1 DUF1415 domain-containing protein [Lysobacter capsici]WND86634.1 DUF1415 domain-containing protein [Lysobacter capsici]